MVVFIEIVSGQRHLKRALPQRARLLRIAASQQPINEQIVHVQPHRTAPHREWVEVGIIKGDRRHWMMAPELALIGESLDQAIGNRCWHTPSDQREEIKRRAHGNALTMPSGPE